MRWFPLLQPLHILYTVVIGFMGKFGSYRWKDRKITQMTTRSRHIRKRLLRNKGALFGLTVISLSVLIAVFAYFLAPDGSPDANRIIVEIGGRSPGFRQKFSS